MDNLRIYQAVFKNPKRGVLALGIKFAEESWQSALDHAMGTHPDMTITAISLEDDEDYIPLVIGSTGHQGMKRYHVQNSVIGSWGTIYVTNDFNAAMHKALSWSRNPTRIVIYPQVQS